MIVGKTGGVTGPQPVEPNRASSIQKSDKAVERAKTDQVEISQPARLLQKLHEMPALRQDRIDEIQKQIADGTYETEAKIRAAVEKLFDDI